MNNLRDYHRATVKKLFQRICEERARANGLNKGQRVDTADITERKQRSSQAVENKN